ncbi:pilus assembly protein PilP [Tateyamaria sp. syn59]|uniref:pilus assembly protein PilP n=1 Tax=Tateyamaria sp. syn59 TaxID=2576942 RepID=UPI0011BE51F5|nr:pilus assembly protein PilP [Tateyamaria sp. syn59]
MSEETNDITADLATQRAALPLRNLQLLGIAGSDSNRRALLRTGGGQTRMVQVGDSLRQGTVIAIGEDRIVLNGGMGQRTLTLPMPDASAA